MKRTTKRRIISILIVALLSAAAMVSAVWFVQKGQPSNAVVTSGQTMFATDGSYSMNLSNQLQTLATNAVKTTVGTAQYSNATQIRTANGGSLPTVNLFQSGGTGTGAAFRNQSWRLVYISSETGGAPVFTFISTEAVGNSSFGSNNTYLNSTVQSTLVSNFNTLLTDFPDISQYIVTPANLPGTWQSNQTVVVSNSTNNSLSGAALNNLIWLPSATELTTLSGGIWGVTQDEVGYTQGSYASTAWTRSGNSSGNGSRVVTTGTNGSLGDSGNNNLNGSLAIRPAIHFSFPTHGGGTTSGIPADQPLFNTNGDHNTIIAGQLRTLATNAAKSTVGTTQRSTATQIRTANNGVLPEIKMFATVGTGHTQSFTTQQWRLVYITHPSGGGAPVFTFMMVNPYRNSAWNPTGTDHVYETSTIRTNLTTDFNTVANNFPGISNNIVLPANLPDAWQSSPNQPDTASAINHRLNGAALNDNVWIPSSAELGDGTAVWGITQAERAFTAGSFSTWAWTRSNGTDTTAIREHNSTAASFSQYTGVTANQAVRPAVHITMPALVESGDSLFKRSGNHSAALVGQLQALANSAAKTTVGTTQRSDAAQIRSANNGSLPAVKLFETVGASNTQSFTNQKWQLAYITRPTGGSPVFTFLMTGAYRSSQFHDSSTNYETSTIRANLTADITSVLNNFPNVSGNIVKPGALPDTWQSNQADSGSYVDNSLTGTALNDYIWLPSYREIANGLLWKLENAERGYTANGFGSYAWMRNRYSATGGTVSTISAAGSGYSSSQNLTTNYAVRPAIHITLPSIVTNSNPLFTVSGNHNIALANQLQELARNTGRSTVGDTQRSDAAQIRTAHGGILPTVKLFESGGVGDVASLRNQSWKLAYITYPSSGSPVFTFITAGAYRNSVFSTGSSTYETSTIRTNLTTDFASVLTSFTGVSSNIVTPRNLPGTWQSNQPDNSSSVNNSISGAALDDSVWLPSSHEFGSGGNLWNLTQAERGYIQDSFADRAWLRCANATSSTLVNHVSPAGAMNGSTLGSYAAYSVRPAIHITLPLSTGSGDIIEWNPQTTHNVKNSELYTNTLATPVELYGATNFTYSVMSGSLPNGLTFNSTTRTISGTPNAAIGAYTFTVRASANGVGVDRTFTINVARGDQAAPTAPTLTINAAGDTVTISSIAGCEYQWRYSGTGTWTNLGTTNTFSVTTGITAGRTYEAQRRYAQTTMLNASPWSSTTSLAHTTYNITYNANSGSGTINTQLKYHGTSNPATLSSGTGFTRLGWTQTGWNTNAAGTGTSYALSGSYIANSAVTLYAVWTRVPITWSQTDASYNVTNGTPISTIQLAAASGGNNTITYSMTGLPSGLSFDPATRQITGTTPAGTQGIFNATATATSAYDSGSVTASRTITFSVSLPTQATPSAPTLTMNATGNQVTIQAITGGVYQWRYAGASTWTSLTSNVFTVTTGITAGRTYEAQRCLAATETHNASAWSSTGSLTHQTYTITYNSNGGSGSIPNGTKYYGTSNPAALSNGSGFSYPGWIVTGWNTNAAGTGTSYSLSGNYTANAAVTLYAVWETNPVTWSLTNSTTNITNGVAITDITLPTATGGYGDITYTVTGLPTGLSFNAATLIISGTPLAIPDTYYATATATSTGGGTTIEASRILTFNVAIGSQTAPAAPTLGLNSAGNTITIETVTNGKYRWRLSSSSTWTDLNLASTFTIQTGISTDRTYEVQRCFAATETHSESAWSLTGSLAHPKYTITYNSNGGSGSIANQNKYHGTSNPVTLNNGGNFSRVGWTITGWNTNAAGTGTAYSTGASYTLNSALALFAVWERTPISWTITTNTHNVTNSVTITDIILPAATGGNNTYTYSISGLPNGLSFNALSSSRTISGTPNATPNTYSVTVTVTSAYEGGSVEASRTLTFIVAMGSQTAPTAPTISMNTAGNTITITHTAGHEYQWRYGGGSWTNIASANTFTITTGITASRTYEVQRRLAVTSTHNESPWSSTTTLTHATYSIGYNSNSGSGTISAQTKYHGTSNPLSLNGGTNFTRTGWNLTGWNTAANGSGTAYSLSASYTANAAATMYAVWAQNTIDWSPQLSHSAINGVAFTHTFAAGTEQFGATNFVYSHVTGTGILPNGLTFNATTRVLSGTPNTTPGVYTFTLRATIYGINLDRVITVTVAAGSQTAPSAPTATMNAAGNLITIQAVSGGEYQWKLSTASNWTPLGTNNTFIPATGISSAVTYQVQRCLAKTDTHNASPWSSTGTLTHATYSVQYDRNGGTTGTITNQTKYHGTLNPITLNSGTYTRPGWNLANWNTAANGSGTSYALAAQYTENAAVTLYAIWIRKPITWSLEDSFNHVSNSVAITDILLPMASGGNDTIIYTVTGLPNGLIYTSGTRTISGTPNAPSGTYDAIATATSTYDSGSVQATRTITFAVSLANQGAPSAPTLTLNETGNTVTILALSGGEYRYRINGGTWSSPSTTNTFNISTGISTGATYDAQRRLAANQTHAVGEWSDTGSLTHTTYTITYNSNGGSGSILNQTKYHGTSNPITLSGVGNFKRNGWNLTSWNTEANSSGAQYALNGYYAGNAALTLYAIWERIPISWSLTDSSNNVTNGVAIQSITLPQASGGNETIVYNVTGLPVGLTYNTSSRIISGTPNAIPGEYSATATATSAYDSGSVVATRTISFTVMWGSQTTPAAPTLTINATGDLITISSIIGAEYQWKLTSQSTWTSLNTTSAIIIPTGISTDRTYEVQIRLAKTDTLNASAWSASGTLTHPKYTITYNNNGGEGTIASQTKYHGTSNALALSGGTGFSRTGWNLVGWNTTSSGNGTAYALNGQYTANNVATLYAVWSGNSISWNPLSPHIVTYGESYTHTFVAATDPGGAIDFVYSHVAGSLPNGITFNAASRTLSGTPAAALGEYTIILRASIGGIDTDRAITIEVRAGSQTAPDAPTLSINDYGNTITIDAITRGEYRWRYTGEVNWNDLNNSSSFVVTVSLSSGRTYEAQRRIAQSSTLSASPWSASGTLAHPTYTIVYDSNGGTGSITSQTKYHGTSNPLVLSGGGGFARNSWTLVGWNTESNGTGTQFSLTGSYNGNGGMTLFAMWERIPISWNLADSSTNVTNEEAITDIRLPFATGGNGNITYTVTGLPNGLIFNAGTLTISGIPVGALGTHNATATATSTYEGGSVSTSRTLSFVVALAYQITPEAPILEVSAAGNIVTISTIVNGEYEWRVAGSATWINLGKTNTFSITPGISKAEIYEARRRYGFTTTHEPSDWSDSGTLTHPTYTVSYSANGGIGSIQSQIKFHGTLNPVTLSNGANFTRSGWTLTGWNTTPLGAGTSIELGGQYTENVNVTMYAMWSRNSMSWNPTLSLPNGVSGLTYTRSLTPLASGIDQTFTYETYYGNIESYGLTLSESGIISGTLPTVATATTIEFRVRARSSNGDSVVSGYFTLIITLTPRNCADPCYDQNCPIHYNPENPPKPTLPDAKLQKDNDKVVLTGVTNPGIFTYSWSLKLGNSSFVALETESSQTTVTFTQDAKQKITYRCQIFYNGEWVRDVEYEINPSSDPEGTGGSGIIIFVLVGVVIVGGVCVFIFLKKRKKPGNRKDIAHEPKPKRVKMPKLKKADLMGGG